MYLVFALPAILLVLFAQWRVQSTYAKYTQVPNARRVTGAQAAQTLLQGEVKIGAARGRLHAYRDIPVIVTYHPAYLLRSPQEKARAWQDLCAARELVKTKS